MKNASCRVCKEPGEPSSIAYPITEDLIATWGLDRHETEVFNRREGIYCSKCGCSNRSGSLAVAIAAWYKCTSFKDFIEYANNNNLKVAEINSAGQLHPFLKEIDGLMYSEYNPDRAEEDPPHEDITELSYEDSSFDLVLHSETLEHIPDPMAALEEIKRILKPDGVCLFTIPVVITRKTKKRFKGEGDNSVLIGETSYHGYGREDCVVWWEYGYDASRYFPRHTSVCRYNNHDAEYIYKLTNRWTRHDILYLSYRAAIKAKIRSTIRGVKR